MATVEVKRGDVGVLFTDTLKSNGVVVNLTSANVKFILKNGGTTVAQAAIVVAPTLGTVSYTSVSGDLAIVGTYDQEWEVTYPASGKVMTFPSDGYNTVEVLPDLG